MSQLIHLEEKRKELENLAGLGYTIKQMALYFDVNENKFRAEAENEKSEVYYHIQRGILLAEASEQMGLLAEAQAGTAIASKQLGEIRRTKAWELSRTDIFAGFNDKKLLKELEDYIQGGELNKMSNEEKIYMDALTLFNSMGRKYGRRNTVRFFTQDPWNLKYARSSEMYDEAISLFYTDRNVEKKALRNRYAEEVEEAALVVRSNAVSAKDWGIYAKMLETAAKFRGLDQEDPEKVPKELYMPPVRVYSLNSEDIGLPKISRQEVASQIEALEIPEMDKQRLLQDALIESFNLPEKLNELEEEAKAEEQKR